MSLPDAGFVVAVCAVALVVLAVSGPLPAAPAPAPGLPPPTTRPGVEAVLQGLKLTPADEITRRVEAARPSRGGVIPADLASRLGSTHVSGKYHLTKEPFLIEGAKALHAFGFKVAKFWFMRDPTGYPWNSDWQFPKNSRLVDLAKHPYYQQAFDLPFTTIILETHVGSPFGADRKANFAEEEAQIYEVSKHLLTTYRQREVTFVLQNWEGDWLARRKAGLTFKKDAVPPGMLDNYEAILGWFAARQRGVDRARAEVKDTRCRVLHAIEVNRLFDSVRDGVPTLATHVLPYVPADLVSWSCYEMGHDPVKAWQGVEVLRHCAAPRPDGSKPGIVIGEIGLPESEVKPEVVREYWDRCLPAFWLANVGYIVQWELYCNEPKGSRESDFSRTRPAEELRGFWLIRPDGSLSHTGRYFRELLDHAGRTLP